jgi:SAM-dependent methyltransferase
MDNAEKEVAVTAKSGAEELLPQSDDGLNFYLMPSGPAIDECSIYRLWPEERYLLETYCRNQGRILDIACGLGRTTLCMHEMGLHVLGMDFSESLIRVAQRRFPYLDLRVGSLTETNEPDASFQSCFISSQAIDLLHPEARRMDALRECARILEQGGTLICSSYNVKCLHLFSPHYWRRPLWKLRRAHLAFRRFAAISDGGIQGIFTAPEAVIAQAEDAGFHFVEMRGPSMSSSPIYNRYRSIYIYYVFRKL